MKAFNSIKKNIFLIVTSLLFSLSLQAQLKIQDSGKIQVGNAHSSDNGWLKIGNDGVANGLSFYDSSTGGTDARIFRSGNLLFISRGASTTNALRINSKGWLGIGTTSLRSATDINSPLSVYRDGGSCISTYANHVSDDGDAIRSVVYRAKTVAYAAWYNGNKTFFVHGNGSIYSNFQLITSDLSTKRNVETITNSLSKVLQLRGVTFESIYDEKEAIQTTNKNVLEKADMENDENNKLSPIAAQINKEKSRKHMGVVAQEVEAVVPEVVRTIEDGRKAVSYTELVGLLIEAIKEQQIQIENLQALVNGGAKVNDLTSSSLRSDQAIGTLETDSLILECKLYQNAPNPFCENTEIRYYLPKGINQAFICIFDMQGKMLHKLDISVGDNRILLEGSKLDAGMYIYSMIAAGVEVDTKRMILTK